MAQKNNLQKKIKSLTLLINHIESRKNILDEYISIGSDNIRAKYAKKIASYRLAGERKLLALEFGKQDAEGLFDTQATQLIDDKKKALRMKYRAKREDTRRQIIKTPEKESELNKILDDYQLELDNQLDIYKAKLSADKAKFVVAHSSAQKKQNFAKRYEEASAHNDVMSQEYADKQNKLAEQKVDRLTKSLQAKIATLDAKLLLSHNKLDELGVTSYEGMLDENTVMRVDKLCMYFGGLKAVDQLDMVVKKNEIYGLIGPNGAGKTTVFNCITKFYSPTAGDVYFRNSAGKVVRLNDEVVHDVVTQGISRTFQNVEVIKEISVLDNLLVSAHRQYTTGLLEHALHLPILAVEEQVISARADKVLTYMGLAPYRNSLAWGLPYGILKRIEIARTLMTNPKLIILDEPAAGLNDTETAELADLIRKIRDEFDVTILLVEHDMGLVMDICDHICVISFGQLLANGTPTEIQGNKLVQEAYLGVSED